MTPRQMQEVVKAMFLVVILLAIGVPVGLYVVANQPEAQAYDAPAGEVIGEEWVTLKTKQMQWAAERGYRSPDAMRFAMAWQVFVPMSHDRNYPLDFKINDSFKQIDEFLAEAGYPQPAPAEKEK